MFLRRPQPPSALLLMWMLCLLWIPVAASCSDSTDVGADATTDSEPSAADTSVTSVDNRVGSEDADADALPVVETDPGIPSEVPGAVTVLAAGDSVTMGRSDRPSWRYPFQRFARERGCPIDMVGSETQWADGAPTSGYSDFDHEHQSRGGRTTMEVAQAVVPVAPGYQPDVALIHTGTNDLTKQIPLDEAGVELRRMVTALQDARPGTRVYLAEIIPAGPALAAETVVWNTEIRLIASDLDTLENPVRTVDMFTDWQVDVMTVAEDNIHPNQQGAEFIANKWLDALVADGVCP